jgi:hypothetical protein
LRAERSNPGATCTALRSLDRRVASLLAMTIPSKRALPGAPFDRTFLRLAGFEASSGASLKSLRGLAGFDVKHPLRIADSDASNGREAGGGRMAGTSRKAGVQRRRERSGILRGALSAEHQEKSRGGEESGRFCTWFPHRVNRRLIGVESWCKVLTASQLTGSFRYSM